MNVSTLPETFKRLLIVSSLALLIAGALPASAAEEETWSIEMRQGDTITAIAKRYLKNPDDWLKLQQYNKVRLDRAMPVGSRVIVPADWMRLVDIEAQVIATRGTVRIERGGTEVPANPGTAVKAGDRISAAEASSITLKFPDGSTSSLHANTHARIELMRGVPSTDLIAQRLRLDAGRIEHAITPRTNASSRFEVETPVAVIGVRGTKFRTSVDDTSRGEVLEGRVEARGSGSPTPVAVDAGYATIIPASGIPSQPIGLLPPPDLSKIPSTQELNRPVFSFAAIPKADQYRAMVARDAQFADMVSETVGNTPRLQLATIADGNYHLLVRGIDSNRLEGEEKRIPFSVKAGTPPPPDAVRPAYDSSMPGGANVILSWSPEKQAASYRFQVAADERFNRVLHSAQRTILLFASRTLPAGRYYWRLASNRADGQPGPWGPIMQFVVSAAEPAAQAEAPPEAK